MLWFKRCPRCQGDLANDRDRYGVYLYCLQCGWLKDVAPVDEPAVEIRALPA
ncbi:MAG: hypothetical protein V1724_06515 [Chloroflexota bacterium]